MLSQWLFVADTETHVHDSEVSDAKTNRRARKGGQSKKAEELDESG